VLNLRSLRKHIASGATDALVALRCVDDLTLAADRIASNVRALQTLSTHSGSDAVDLAAVVSSALRLAAPTLEPRAQVTRRIASTAKVCGEESRLGQAVLAMLLFSSSGFSESGDAGGEIVVAVEPRGPRVVVEVSDNGRDLAPEEAEHAFDPFFRSPARGAGVGVGLGIARSVASTLGGDVSLARRDTTEVDLAAVVSAALRLATPTLEEHAHVIRQIFPVRRVLGEESRIGQAVLAMLLFSSSGFETQSTNVSNRIVVSVEQRDDDVVLEVSDNGHELTPDEANHAFDPFYRSSVRGAGVGVGLGVARSVAAALGGEVTLARRAGGGAVITMRLRASAA